MKRALWAGLVAVLSLGWVTVGWMSTRSVAIGADAPGAKNKADDKTAADKTADKNKTGDKKEAPATDSGQQEPNRVKYARTYLSLAKLDLEMAQSKNRQVRETIPPALLLVLEENVHLAELWLEQEQAEVEGKTPIDSAIRLSEIRLKAAELNYKQLLEANNISKLPPQRLERARLKVELAKLNVAGAKELEGKPTAELIEFEVDRLREEVAEMYVRQLKLLDRN